MRRYLVWTFDYYHDSAGQKVMHRLAHELNQMGQTAYVAFPKRNPLWNTPYHPGPLHGDWIAIYPEIIKGNPWKAPHVVRYVLNNPGKLGGDTTYDPAEIVYIYHELFNDMGVPPERVLHLPAIELDIYTDRHEPREGEVFYVGKGQQTREIPGATEITNELKRDQRLLAETFNHATLLHCFDNVTAMTLIANLCGCPVKMIPNGEYTRDDFDRLVRSPGIGWDEVPPPFDSDVVRAEQVTLYDAFKVRLRDFIRVTQA